MSRMAHLSALVAVVGGLEAYSLPTQPPPPDSSSNVPTGEYLTIEVPSPKASGAATAEPTEALVPSWVLASDPAKAPHDCTITMEIGYVRKWCVPTTHLSFPNHKKANRALNLAHKQNRFDFEKVPGTPINQICVPDPHYPFTPGGDGRQCRAVKTVAISPVKPGCEARVQRKVVVWRELRTGNDLRRPDGTVFEDPDGFGTPEPFCDGDEGCFGLSGYSSGPVGSTG
ncbi:hypothetical protein KC331_g5730 [Hortaea werneckii]|nr:hypothetical protein KC331_g5730 [Hortaea werneckii]KAI7713913.1 hypothetical protein KC353_g7191 [Hortaea werneckii]